MFLCLHIIPSPSTEHVLSMQAVALVNLYNNSLKVSLRLNKAPF